MKKLFFILILLFIAFSIGCIDKNQHEIADKRDNSSMNYVGNEDNISDNYVTKGDNVSVNYIKKYDNGTVFDTSLVDVAKEAGLYDANRIYEPMSFVAGTGIFGKNVLNMTIDEKKTFRLSPDEAYGEYNPEYCVPFPRSEFENVSLVPEIGRRVETILGFATIVDINETDVILDFNPPYVGKNVTFDITIVSIEKAPIYKYDASSEYGDKVYLEGIVVSKSLDNNGDLQLEVEHGSGMTTVFISKSTGSQKIASIISEDSKIRVTGEVQGFGSQRKIVVQDSIDIKLIKRNSIWTLPKF